jgi:hypothetical protein
LHEDFGGDQEERRATLADLRLVQLDEPAGVAFVAAKAACGRGGWQRTGEHVCADEREAGALPGQAVGSCSGK